MRHYKLHELIEMARAGKKFKAISCDIELSLIHEFFNVLYTRGGEKDRCGGEKDRWVVIFEPEVVEFDIDCTTLSPDNAIYIAIHNPKSKPCEKLDAKKWRVVCTEIIGEKERGL